MSLFYIDENIINNENELNFNFVIDYLEKRFEIKHNIDLLVSLIGNSWYYFIEGNINQSPIEYNPEKFLCKWKKYIDIGLNEFNENPTFCLIAGYTLMLHGFFIDPSYEKVGIKLLENCSKSHADLNLIQLSKYWLFNYNAKKYKLDKKIDLNKVCDNLFNSKTLLDKYFREILKRK